MGSLQPSPKLKWISNTLGLSGQFFFPNGLSPAQSKVEMNLKHLGAAQPGLKLKFSRDLVVLKLVDLLYLLNSLGCPAQWCLILISNLMGSPAQMNYGSYSPSTKGLYNPSLQHCFPHTLFCGAVQFVRILKKISWYRPSAGKRGWYRYSLYCTWPPQIGWVSQKTKIICLMVC